MILEAERTLIQSSESGSLSVVLPKGWITYHKMKKGNEIAMFGNDCLILLPKEKANPKYVEKIKAFLANNDVYGRLSIE